MYEDVVAFWQANQVTEQELNEFCMLFAYHCNAIGNPQTTLEATKGIYEHGGVSNFTGDLHTLIEIENQKYMAVYLKDKVEAREPLSVELVRADAMIVRYTPKERGLESSKKGAAPCA